MGFCLTPVVVSEAVIESLPSLIRVPGRIWESGVVWVSRESSDD